MDLFDDKRKSTIIGIRDGYFFDKNDTYFSADVATNPILLNLSRVSNPPTIGFN